MRSVEELAGRVRDPVAKLRFIQGALGRYDAMPAVVRRLRLVRAIALRIAAFSSLADVIAETEPLRAPEPPRWGWLLYRARHVLFALGALLAVLAFSVAGQWSFRAAAAGLRQVAKLSEKGVGARGNLVRLDTATRAAAPLTAPDRIWLVEKRTDSELWSNGLRITTTHETRGEPRSYLALPRSGDALPRPGSEPIGIVYHTTENDMAPFEPDFNRSILETTENLLGYLRRRGLYNYLIDRFGRVYRIVRDSDAASHAGKSVWGDDLHLYLNLNDSFIGVSFETRWSPRSGGVDVLTAAQIQAGTMLTHMLRARFEIEDINCTTHGLVSVSPGPMLIGHHRDWAKGFPFEAFGLADKYQVTLPSVSELGFRYGPTFAEEVDGLWPGLLLADQDLERRAGHQGIAVAALRLRQRDRYFELVETLRRAKEAGPAAAGALSSGR
jgi:hypothetical protein